ncbi:preprotein translocase subunit SecY [Rhizobium leguminosarum]|nr:preprotein translocase subunit SecY [Rhizobium leguminosarum]
MDSRQMIITFALIGIVYTLALHIPLPGIDLDAFASLAYTANSDMLSRISILLLGPTPLFAALGLAEIARLIAFPWLKQKDEQDRSALPGGAIVVVIALAIAAVQAYAMSGGLGAARLVDDNMTNFTMLTIASCVGATALTIFLSDRIGIAGLRDGLWPLYSIPILLSLPNNVIASVEMTRTGAVPSTQWLIVAVYLVLSVAAVVVTAFLWRSACHEACVIAEKTVEPGAILIWPPVLAITVAGYVLASFAFIAPNVIAAAQGLPLQIIALAMASILIPLIVFAYVRRLEVKNGANIRLAATASIIAFIQILLLVSGALASAFIQLPVSPGSIGIIVLTITALGFRSWDTVEVEGSSAPHVSAQTAS